MDERRRRVRVVVAGAGLAGLTAARCLERAGAEVTVVEARSRVGGRVCTVRDEFVAGQHAEAGADLIESEQKDVLALAAELKLDTVPILKRGWGFYGRGRRGLEIRASAPDLFERVARWLEPEIAAYKAADCRWDSAVAAVLARESVAGWMARRKLAAPFTAALRGLRGFFLADPEDLSLLVLVDQFAQGDTPGDATMHRIRDGNDLLPRTMAGALRGPVVLDAPLRRVSQTPRGVRLAVGGGAVAELTADYVVLALPATTLRQVRIEPGLPDEQAKGIATLPYGPATRVLLQFERRFWQRLGRRTAYGSDRATGAVWDANEQQGRAPGILSLLSGGGASRELQAILERGWPSLVRRLSWLGTPARLLHAEQFTWEAERWSQGGYAVFGPRFEPTLRAWLARPAGRLAFAGEHTSMRFQGFMNGAVESGRRAALEIALQAGLDWRAVASR